MCDRLQPMRFLRVEVGGGGGHAYHNKKTITHEIIYWLNFIVSRLGKARASTRYCACVGLLECPQFTAVTCNLIAVVNVRTTEEAEPATYGTIKENQQQPPAVASVNTGAPLKAQLWFCNQLKKKKPTGLHMEPQMHVQLWSSLIYIPSDINDPKTLTPLQIVAIYHKFSSTCANRTIYILKLILLFRKIWCLCIEDQTTQICH